MKEQMSPSHPLKAIASKFEKRANAPFVQTSAEGSHDQEMSAPPPHSTACPVLSPKRITAPALLFNSELRIVWQNEAAQTQLWRIAEAAANEPDLHLLTLLLSRGFRAAVSNWKEWVAFFIRQSQPLLAPQELRRQIEIRDASEREMLQSVIDELQTAGDGGPANRLHRLTQNESENAVYCVVGTTFDKGRLLVFEKESADLTDDTTTKAGALHRRLSSIRQHSVPVKVVFYALAARLDNADALRAEMLDEQYSLLLQRLWADTIQIMAQHGGIAMQFAVDGMMGFFLPEADGSVQNPAFVIRCALALKARMGELGREWKIRKGWLHDLQLNMGIDIGDEYLLTLPSVLGENLVPAGDTVHTAAYLARQAVNGQIWATKPLVNQLPPEDLNEIQFGIFRSDNNRRIFIPSCFSRIRELSDDDRFLCAGRGEIGARSATQIFDQVVRP